MHKSSNLASTFLCLNAMSECNVAFWELQVVAEPIAAQCGRRMCGRLPRWSIVLMASGTFCMKSYIKIILYLYEILYKYACIM